MEARGRKVPAGMYPGKKKKKKTGAVDLTSLTMWKIIELLENVEIPSIDSKKTNIFFFLITGEQVIHERKFIMAQL